MGLKINGHVPVGNVNRTHSRSDSRKAEARPAASTSEGSERVSLSEKENASAIGKSATRGVSEVDEAKVAEIRDQLARGEYEADLSVVAERIIAEAFVFGDR